MAEFDILFYIGQSFLLLFVVMDPIGAVPFFTALTRSLSKAERNRVANRTTIITFLLLSAFAYAGSYILLYLGVTISDFQVAGGIFLLVFGLRDAIVGEPLGVKGEEASQSVSIFPLATPLLAGPGSITTVMLISGMPNGLFLVFVTIGLNCIASWFLFRISSSVSNRLGKTGLMAIAKLLDIIMGALGVAYISVGLRNILAA